MEDQGTVAATEQHITRPVFYLDDYPSYGGTPNYGGTPKATPLRDSSSSAACTPQCGAYADAISDTSPSFILRSVVRSIVGGIARTDRSKGTGGGGGGHNVDVDVDVDEVCLSNATRARETDICADVEAAGGYPAVEGGGGGGGGGGDPADDEGFRELASVGKPLGSSKPPLRIDLKFKNVNYKVTCQKATKWRGKSAIEKQILHGITGSVACGEMLAMMGPSGSGKTTLLNLLGGRRCNNHNIYGSIQYNQLPYARNLKRRMGFVTQDDVLFPHLTVRETLRFAALLRLGRDLTKVEKVGRAEEVLGKLGLQQCANTVIGNQFLPGVSGGERKRVCIGQEILVNPSLLFLDEPTSGLDSTTTLRLIKLLQQFAHEGRTVVTTIHQPSSRVFHMFDKILLLSDGHGIYFGKAREATTYFDSIGFSPFIPMNPADFLLDLCSGNITDMSLPQSLKESIITIKHSSSLTSDSTKVSPTPSTDLANDVKKYLVHCYEKKMVSMESYSKAYSHVGSRDVAVMSKGELAWEMRMWGTTWWEQFVILWIRGMKERRHEYLSALRIIQVVVSSFLAGCLWWKSKHVTPQQLQDQVGLIFFIVVFWGYLPMFTAIFAFPLERAMLVKERSSDMYRLSAFFMARILGDLPLDLALPCVFMVILYFMTNLQQTLNAFILTLLTIFLTVLTSQGFGLLIGATMMDVQKATTFASIAILVFMLAGGFFVKYIPPFISWIKYFSFQAYTFNILIQIQYENDATVHCQSGPSCQRLAIGALHGTPLHDATKSAMALLIMVFGYRLLAYIALRCMRTTT